MDSFIGILFLCIVTEALVEYVKTLVDAFDSKEFKAAGIRLFALAVSVVLCLSTGMDLMALFGISFGNHLGCILTGVFASRGANYMHDFIGKLQKAQKEVL